MLQNVKTTIDQEFELLGEYMKVYIQLLPYCKEYAGVKISRHFLPSFKYFKDNYYNDSYSLNMPHFKECMSGNNPIHTHGLSTEDGDRYRFYNYWMGCKYFTGGNMSGEFKNLNLNIMKKDSLENQNTSMILPDVFVYLVECSSGSWDSYHNWIGGVFEKPEDAEKYAQELNEKNKLIKEIECPVRKPIEDMTEDEEKQYYRWWNDNNNATEWNGAEVKQYPLNKPYV